MVAHNLASWDHVESILRHERINEGRGNRLLSLVARLRAAGFDRRLVARRTWQASLVLARTRTRAIGARDPVVVFVCHDDRVIAFFGTSDSFRACCATATRCRKQLTEALSMLAS